VTARVFVATKYCNASAASSLAAGTERWQAHRRQPISKPEQDLTEIRQPVFITSWQQQS
jgi:hypothetical protein